MTEQINTMAAALPTRPPTMAELKKEDITGVLLKVNSQSKPMDRPREAETTFAIKYATLAHAAFPAIDVSDLISDGRY